MWGVAYTIDSAYVAEVREYLGGYVRKGPNLLSNAQDGSRLPREGWYRLGLSIPGSSPLALDRMAIPWSLWISMAMTNMGKMSY